MIKEFTFTGKTIDEAIAAGCNELHVDRDEVSVEVLETPTRSFLGFKVTPAKVKLSVEAPDEPKTAPVPKSNMSRIEQTPRFTPAPQQNQFNKSAGQPMQNRPMAPQTQRPQQQNQKQPQPQMQRPPLTQQAPKQEQTMPRAPQTQMKPPMQKPAHTMQPERPVVPISDADMKKASENVTVFLDEVMRILETGANVKINSDNGAINAELAGSNMGIIIGRRGETLDALQYLSSLIANKGHEEYIKVNLDTENYREKRTASLTALAEKVAAKVEKNKKSVVLEPMNPYERRIIHSVLQDNANVVTVSVGSEPNRKVVVHPAGMQPEKAPQGRYNRNRRPNHHRPNTQNHSGQTPGIQNANDQNPSGENSIIN